MKPIRRFHRFLIAFLLITICSAVSTVCLMAQDAPAPAPNSIGDTAATVAAPFIVSFATNHSWVLTILSVVGIMRVIFKPLISFLEAAVKATPTSADDAFLAKCEGSVAYRWFAWGLDWLGSIKHPGSPTTNPALTAQGK
jgi:hypothetical protein